MNEHPLDCQQALNRSSSYRDGRLAAHERARVQEHLGQCAPCLSEYKALQRLSRLAAAMPRVEVDGDLARDVRRALHKRRAGTLRQLDTPRWGGALRVAAALALLIPGAVYFGYVMGQQSGDATRETANAFPPAAADDDSSLRNVSTDAWTPYRDQGMEPERFLRASHSLLGDLHLLDHVEPPVRSPLVHAQIGHFDLAEDARLVLELKTPDDAPELPQSIRDMARFIVRLDGARAPSVLASLQSEARHSDWARALPRAKPRARAIAKRRGPARLRQAVERESDGLERRAQQSLVRLLELKDSWVYGDFSDVIQFAVTKHSTQLVGTPVIDPFVEESVQFLIASALPEVGLDDLAQPFRIQLGRSAPHAIEIVHDGFDDVHFWGENDFSFEVPSVFLSTGSADGLAESILEQLSLNQQGGTGTRFRLQRKEFVVEDEHGMRIQIQVQSQDGQSDVAAPPTSQRRSPNR